jgi:glutamate/tyrosine decarboxylase-like PLP-dependent enzyme
VEEVAAGWLIDLLGLPAGASAGFVTGCHMANFTALAAARHELLRRAGWYVEAEGLQGAPRLRVIVGDEVHVSVIGALRMLGIGSGQIVRAAADDQGRMRPEALAAALAGEDGPAIVCAQAGNVNTGAFDAIDALADVTSRHNVWLHVDGAFGLWAAASSELRHLVGGIARADSCATDAHKWLNVPYDSGLVFVAHPAAHRAAMSLSAAYLVRSADEPREPMDWVPESSRRARGFAVYAALRSLGRMPIMAQTCRPSEMRLPGVQYTGLRSPVVPEVIFTQQPRARTRRTTARCASGGRVGSRGSAVAPSFWMARKRASHRALLGSQIGMTRPVRRNLSASAVRSPNVHARSASITASRPAG